MKIVIPTCDKYSTVVPYNLALLRKFWPDCPYDIVVVATEHRPPVRGVEVVMLGEDKRFGANMRQFLLHHYDHRALLVWLDDYLLVSVDRKMVRKARRLVATGQASTVVLSKKFTPEGGRLHPKDDRFIRVRKNYPYCLSLQASVWNTKILFDQLRNTETIWRTEWAGSIRIAREGRDLPTFWGVTRKAMEYKNYYRRGTIDPRAHVWAQANVEGYMPLGEVPDKPLRLKIPEGQ